MLDVRYEATHELPPGRLAKMDEDRGQVRIRVDKYEPLAAILRQLNIEIEQLLSSAHWFQLWETEIVSRETPGCPLRIRYILSPRVPRAIGVGVGEGRGTVRVYVCPELTTEEFATCMNEATKELLAGGHWFQLFGGEIIDNSPEPVSHI
jgi:hypothetical protein